MKTAAYSLGSCCSLALYQLLMPSLAFTIGLNHLVYGHGSLFLFRRNASSTPQLFSAIYMINAAVSGFFAWSNPTPLAIPIALSWMLSIFSIGLFLRTAYETRTQRLTIITTRDQPTMLHTDGPYAHIRHPFYSAYLANFLASALASRVWEPGALCFTFMSVLYYRYARQEEAKFQESSLAKQYADYKRRTSMLVPLII